MRVYSFTPAQAPKRVRRELMLLYSDNQKISHFPRWCCIQQYHMYTPNLALRIAVMMGRGRGAALEGVLNKRKGASRGLGEHWGSTGSIICPVQGRTNSSLKPLHPHLPSSLLDTSNSACCRPLTSAFPIRRCNCTFGDRSSPLGTVAGTSVRMHLPDINIAYQ